jgi:hypothetical protein
LHYPYLNEIGGGSKYLATIRGLADNCKQIKEHGGGNGTRLMAQGARSMIRSFFKPMSLMPYALRRFIE